MMARTHEKAVEAQFGSRAKAYVDSTVHSQGADLDALDSIVRNSAPTRALDLGTGGGHVSYLMARQAKGVVAVDLSNEMIAAVARTASQRRLGNIETVAAPAEIYPSKTAVSIFSHAATRRITGAISTAAFAKPVGF